MRNLPATGFIDTAVAGSQCSASLTVDSNSFKVTVTSNIELDEKNEIIVTHVSSGKKLNPRFTNFERLSATQFRYTLPKNLTGISTGNAIAVKIAINPHQEVAYLRKCLEANTTGLAGNTTSLGDKASIADVQNGALNFAVAEGTDTYTADLEPEITEYATGQPVTIQFTNANTGAATLNMNDLGAKAIVKNGSTALASGNIAAGQVMNLVYDGTNFQIVGKI